MAYNPTKLSAQEAQTLLLETTGTWRNFYNWFISIGPHPLQRLENLGQKNPKNNPNFFPGPGPLEYGDDATCFWASSAAIFYSLGVYSFVVPYERYKKMCRHYGQDPSFAFGFEKYVDSDGRAFGNDFSVIVHRWAPGDKPKDSWFADMVRNSFAHGQSTMEMQGGQVGIVMCNARDGLTPDFEVFVKMEDFARLMTTAVSNFVAAFVEEGSIHPLSAYVKDLETRWEGGLF
ncbi:hypothetical protein ACN47E_007479 [Coniothyrium glycines]